MRIKVLIVVVALLIASDSRNAEFLNIAMPGQGTTWFLEESEGNTATINLMNSGDYSGCTILTSCSLPVNESSGKISDAAGSSAGLERAILYALKDISATSPLK